MNEHFIEFCHENGVIGLHAEINVIGEITVRIVGSWEIGNIRTLWHHDIQSAYKEMIYAIDEKADTDTILRGEK
jgi:hypothetical protein